MWRNHLFLLNEVLDDKTTMDLGRMWQKHHDRDPYKRFKHRAIEQSSKADRRSMPLRFRIIEKEEELQNQLQNAPDIPFDPNHKYRPGEVKPKGYYQNALDSLDGIVKNNHSFRGAEENYLSRVSRYQGKKLGWEESPGIDKRNLKELYKVFPYKKWAHYDDIPSAVGTMHQRAGERSMAAIGRLTNYLNRNGVNQENPTAQDRTNFEKFRQRMSGHPLWKKS